MDNLSQGISAKDILHFQLKRDVVALYKRYLMTVEDLREDHQEMLRKLRAALPVQYHQMLLACDYFTDADRHDLVTIFLPVFRPCPRGAPRRRVLVA